MQFTLDRGSDEKKNNARLLSDAPMANDTHTHIGVRATRKRHTFTAGLSQPNNSVQSVAIFSQSPCASLAVLLLIHLGHAANVVCTNDCSTVCV